MQFKPCLATIKTEYHKLTNMEKKLADYILKNYENVVLMSVGELAEKAGVVKSLVIRFCKSLGFEGYAQLKLSLNRELVRNEQFNYTPYITGDDNTSDILDKIFSANIKTLHDTSAGIDRKMINDIVNLLEKSKNIFIYAVGISAGIANDFQYRLMQLGYTAFCFTDIVSMKVSTQNIKPGDVAIGISNCGRTRATVDALALARENGAKTVCITSFADSIITQKSDFPVVVCADEIQYPIAAISARIAHISVLDAISISLSAKDFDKAKKRSSDAYDLFTTLSY